jgi:hypothetical protein
MSGPEASTTTSSRNAYSAEVRLSLRLNGRVVPLSRIGPDQVELQHPQPLQPGSAELVLSVDGREHRWLVEITCQTRGSRSVGIQLLQRLEAKPPMD